MVMKGMEGSGVGCGDESGGGELSIVVTDATNSHIHTVCIHNMG